MTTIKHDFAGTPAQQVLQRAIVDHYTGDPRILAVAVFGSLGRGSWDAYSDVDLSQPQREVLRLVRERSGNSR